MGYPIFRQPHRFVHIFIFILAKYPLAKFRDRGKPSAREYLHFPQSRTCSSKTASFQRLLKLPQSGNFQVFFLSYLHAMLDWWSQLTAYPVAALILPNPECHISCWKQSWEVRTGRNGWEFLRGDWLVIYLYWYMMIICIHVHLYMSLCNLGIISIWFLHNLYYLSVYIYI